MLLGESEETGPQIARYLKGIFFRKIFLPGVARLLQVNEQALKTIADLKIEPEIFQSCEFLKHLGGARPS
jgi:hypothetical protein